MNDKQNENNAAGGQSALGGLVSRIHRHLGQLPFHVAQRDSAKLLLEAVERIEAMTEAIDKMPTCKVACDGVLIVSVDRYNKAVQIANG